MQKSKTQDLVDASDEREINLQRERVENAIIEFEKNFLKDIQVYLKQFNFEYSPERAQEIFCQAKITALKAARNYNPQCSARAWIRAVIFNEVRSFLRDEKTRVSLLSVSEAAQKYGFENLTEETSETDLFDYLNQQSAREFFRGLPNADEILSLVNADDRRILHLRYVEGYSAREIAAHFGINEGAAEVRLSRAKNRLRKEFLKQ